MIEFNQCDVIIDEQGVSADSASISEQNKLDSFYFIGYQGSIKTQTGPKTASIQVNYTSGPENEPNFNIINDLKQNPPILNNIYLEIAGLECSGYLTNYSLKSTPNQPAKASASYICFIPITGEISEKRGVIDYEQNTNNFGHGWSTTVTYQNTGFISTYDFDYEININYNPIYSLGTQTPSQVMFVGADERIRVVKDNFLLINFTGHSAIESLLNATGIEQIQIANLTSFWDSSILNKLTIDFTDAKVTSSALDAGLDNYISTEIVAERSF